MRSIPEKTLEHWASIYAAYRYRSFAGLWWPTLGEDISVGSLPNRGPGKIFNLEIKTTEANGSGDRHRAEVRVSQLLAYLSKPVPTYYVFPVPDWCGPIDRPAATRWLAGTSKTELGFRRSGDLWFGNWTVVVPDYVLYAPLAARYPLGTAVGPKVYEPVFTVDTSGLTVTVLMEGAYTGVTAPFMQPPAGMPTTPFYGWREFWDDMDVCGGPGGLQAVFAVPGGGGAPGLSRLELTTKLEAVADQEHIGPLSYYIPVDRALETAGQQVYVRADEDMTAINSSTEEQDNEEADAHLMSVFVSAKHIASARSRQ